MAMPSQEEIQYQLSHINDDRSGDIILSHGIGIALAASAVVLRFVARRLSKAKVGADDYMIVVAFFLALGEIIGGLLSVRFGGAKHAITLTEPIQWAKTVYATELFYNPAIATVKLSALLLYARIFPGRTFRIILWTFGTFIALYNIIEVFLFLFHCDPINGAWDMSVKAKCLDLSTDVTVIGALNGATDIITVLLPLPQLVCVVSIYRATIIGKLSFDDASWVDTDPAIWSAVEVCIGIVSACLPTLRPLWTSVFHSPPSSSRGKTSGGYSGGSSGYWSKLKLGSFGSKFSSSENGSSKGSRNGGGEEFIPLGA
ncbi:MAG: hypothetical protein Q9220_000405 [cf. Caloplaca sp. 1 TL-2023]